jgi:hypothetical protein
MPNNHQPTAVLEPARRSSGADLGGSQYGCGLVAAGVFIMRDDNGRPIGKVHQIGSVCDEIMAQFAGKH